MKLGDRIKVIDQEIYGLLIHDHGTEVVIEDEDADLFDCPEDKQLCFKKSEVELAMPKDWVDASFGGVRVYHAKDLAIYINDDDFEVHNMNIAKSKFSLLLKSDDWENVISFVERRAA
jgi:hypothetical protein